MEDFVLKTDNSSTPGMAASLWHPTPSYNVGTGCYRSMKSKLTRRPGARQSPLRPPLRRPATPDRVAAMIASPKVYPTDRHGREFLGQ